MKKAVDAKEITGNKEVIEDVKLAATGGISKYYSGDEKNIITAIENAVSTEVQGFKEFTSIRGTSPVEGLVTRYGKDHAFSIDANTGKVTTPSEVIDCQWTLVADNDNDGVLSRGDEVAPLIDSVANEHFFILESYGESVKLITKLAVDNVTNSQSSTAPLVSYDMAYCDKEGVEHDFIMPATMIKTPEKTEIIHYESYDSMVVTPAVYYNGTETAKVHCPGTYTKAYGERLKAAGLVLENFSNKGCEYISLEEGSWKRFSNEEQTLFESWIIEDDDFWIGIEDSGVSTEAPYGKWSPITKGLIYAANCFDKKALRPTIQINTDLIQITHN